MVLHVQIKIGLMIFKNFVVQDHCQAKFLTSVKFLTNCLSVILLHRKKE